MDRAQAEERTGLSSHVGVTTGFRRSSSRSVIAPLAVRSWLASADGLHAGGSRFGGLCGRHGAATARGTARAGRPLLAAIPPADTTRAGVVRRRLAPCFW